jgi:glutaredoxin
MQDLILYHHPDCHLCDDAEVLLHSAGLGERYAKVDIDSDLELMKRYGISVPVMALKSDGSELCWPFDQAALLAFAGAGK